MNSAHHRSAWTLLLTILAVAALLAACAGGEKAGSRPNPPDRIILTINGDPAASRAVAWHTAFESPGARAQIAKVDPANRSGRLPQDIDARSQRIRSGTSIGHHHEVVFGDLKAGAFYAYRVGDESSWSDWAQFQTAWREARPFRFLYFGDTQNDLRGACARLIRRALADVPDARFLLYAGDLTDAPSQDAEWGDWMAMAGSANRSIPSLPAIGNHQYKGAWLFGMWRVPTPYWQAHFALPTNGIPGLEETHYFLDYQGVRIVVLNSMEKLAQQAEWLDGLLSGNPQRWTVAVFHYPVFAGIRERQKTELQRLWKPVLERHAVDLVLQGHDHVYGRSRPAAGTQGGPVYVVSVAGSKMYAAGDRSWAERSAQDTQMFQVVSVEGDSLRFEARTVEGELYDAFEFRHEGGRKVFSSRSPGPERLRPGTAGPPAAR